MKIDLKKETGCYAARRGRIELVTVPPLQYLMIDGHGDPNTAPAYAAALATLYPVAYALKFFSKRELDRDYTVMPLEALWWADDMGAFTSARDKSQWNWTVLNLIPEWLGQHDLDAARSAVGRKGTATRLDDLRLDRLDEGLAMQTLHVGRYDDEGPILDRMHREFTAEHGLRLAGTHHEIYLSDARRTAPEKLRTIQRQPVIPA